MDLRVTHTEFDLMKMVRDEANSSIGVNECSSSCMTGAWLSIKTGVFSTRAVFISGVTALLPACHKSCAFAGAVVTAVEFFETFQTCCVEAFCCCGFFAECSRYRAPF